MKSWCSCAIWATIVFMLLIGCGSGGGSNSESSENTGTLSIAITDAKPLIPDNPTKLWVYFDGVHAYGPDVGLV